MPLVHESAKQHTVDLLDHRINNLESAFLLGASSGSLIAATYSSVNARLDQADLNLQKQEKEIPGLKACEELLAKLKPLISDRRSSLKHTVERVDELLIKEEEITQHVASLSIIERLAGSINSPHFSGN